MSTTQQQAGSNGGSLSINFFDVYNGAATMWEARTRMQQYRKKLRAKGKRGGPNQNTKEVLYAIFTSVCQTMNRIQRSQPELFQRCLEEGKYFCFTTNPSLKTIVNKGKNFDDTGVHKDTIRNQINLLLEMDIITEKHNYRVTENRHADPLPHDMLVGGRGKIRLDINPEVFQTMLGQAAPSDSQNSAPAPTSGIIVESFDQYPLTSKELKERITNTVEGSEEQKALAIAKTILSNNLGKVRVSKHPQSELPNIAPENLAAEHQKDNHLVKSSHEMLSRIIRKNAQGSATTYVFALWQLMRAQLYQGEAFNEDVRNTSMEMLQQLLVQAQNSVRAYRKQKIEAFKKSDKYLERAPNKRATFLKWFQKRLPNVERSALEIVGKAIEIQKKHAEKHQYQVWRPVSYLASGSAQQALGYSLDNWLKLKKGFFNKNMASLERFQQQQLVQETYTNVVETLRTDGEQAAHLLAKKKYLEWLPNLQANADLSASTKIELQQSLVQKFKALFNHG